MADITAKRGPIDPNDYVTNQGVATQGQVKGLDRDIRYAETQPSTWDSVMGGIKDVMDVGKSALSMVNSYKDLDVKDTQIKVAEEQIEASKLNRQKTELEMENVKQTMHMKSIEFDMALQEKKEENEYLNTVMELAANKDVDKLNQFMGEHAKLTVKKYSKLAGALGNHFKGLEGNYNTEILDLFAEMGTKDPTKKAFDQAQILEHLAKADKAKAETEKIRSETTGGMDLFTPMTSGGKSKKANPEMAKQYADFEYNLASATNLVSNYKTDGTGVGSNIATAANNLGMSIHSMKDMGNFIQSADIEVFNPDNAYKIKQIENIINDKNNSATIPSGITTQDFMSNKDTGFKGMSIVKFTKDGKSSYVVLDKDQADLFVGLKNYQTALTNKRNYYKQSTGKDLNVNPDLLGGTDPKDIGRNSLASLQQPQRMNWYSKASPEEQKKYIDNQIFNIKQAGNDQAIIDYVFKELDKDDKDRDTGVIDDLAEKRREFRKASPGSNINIQREYANNSMLKYILTKTAEGASLDDIRDDILSYTDPRQLDWEEKSAMQLDTINKIIADAPDTEVETSTLPTPSYKEQAGNVVSETVKAPLRMIHPALSRGMAKAGGMLASIGDGATMGNSKPAVIKAKEIPEYVTNNFISKDTKQTLVQNEASKLNAKDTNGLTSVIKELGNKYNINLSKSVEDNAKNIVDKAVYEFITKAHNKGYSYADIEDSLKLVTDIDQLPQLLNNMLDYKFSNMFTSSFPFITGSFSQANDYELDSSGKLVKKLYSSNRQRQKKLYKALKD